MSEQVTISMEEFSRLIAIKNAAQCWAEATEIAGSMPFRGLLFGVDRATDELVAKQYNDATGALYRAVYGLQLDGAEPITASLAAMVRSLPDISDHVRATVLKALGIDDVKAPEDTGD